MLRNHADVNARTTSGWATMLELSKALAVGRGVARWWSAELPADEHRALSKAADATARHIPVWCVMGLGIAGSMFAFNPSFPAVPWLAAFAVCTVFAWIEERPFRKPGMVTTTRRQMVRMGAATALWACVLGYPAIYCFTEGLAGRSLAIFLLAGGIIGAYVSGRWHAAFVVVSSLPLVAYALGLPLYALVAEGSSEANLITLAASALFTLSLVPLWLSSVESERQEAQYRAEIENRRAQAESATAAKSAFIATVSHELRTPISAILAGSAELEQTSPPGPAQANARLILDAGRMMRVLLNDLLDLSKLEAGRMTVEEIAYDFRTLIADQVRFWRTESRKKGVRLQLDNWRGAPPFVASDPTRLRQITNNLLSNALKFTDTGSVTLRFVGAEDRGEQWRLRIEIADTGAGISPIQLSRLFKPFDQGDTSVARTHGGTGLGLSISRDLARLMGGDITAASVVGQGSTFTLWFDVRKVDALESSALTSAETRVDVGRACEILVVDDHEINRRAIGLILGSLDLGITMVTSGAEALAVLERQPFDLVLMDVHMPQMDGREATRRLRRATGPNQATPVIAVTGSVSEDDIAACLAAGMSDWVAKPIEASELFAALERSLAVRDSQAGPQVAAHS